MSATACPNEAPGVMWRPETLPCPACGSDERKVLGRRGGSAHRLRLGAETTVVRCLRCHLVYQRPVLLPEGNPYAVHAPDSYFYAHDRGQKQRLGEGLAARAEALLGRKGRLLELGCGRGDLLMGAAAAGWAVRGVEMTRSFAAAGSGVEIEVARVEEARSLDGTYEVIVLGAILEHLYDPRECLRRVHRALVSGGLVFIDVPNECSLWTRAGNLYMRLRRRDWAVNLSPSFPPFHVVGFCPTSLRRLLAATGFEVIEIRTHRWQNLLPPLGGPWGAIEGLGAGAVLTVGHWIGMGAGITCWARRGEGSGNGKADHDEKGTRVHA